MARLVLETKYGIIEVWRSGIGTPLAGEVSRYPGVSMWTGKSEEAYLSMALFDWLKVVYTVYSTVFS